MKRSEILRILDANFNRSREGLRVCEEIARFLMEDALLTARLKKARHAISGLVTRIPAPLSELMASRNTKSDIGKEPSEIKSHRKNALGLFMANIQRAKEALRALEETAKLLDNSVALKFKKIRFEAYGIEQVALPKLEALCDRGSGGDAWEFGEGRRSGRAGRRRQRHSTKG